MSTRKLAGDFIAALVSEVTVMQVLRLEGWRTRESWVGEVKERERLADRTGFGCGASERIGHDLWVPWLDSCLWDVLGL